MIREGYQQTAIGLIPCDWEVKKVGDICDFIVPGRNKPKNFGGDIPWITTPDINDDGSVSNSKLGLLIPRDEAKKIGSKVVPINSVIMTCAGELGLVALTKNEIVVNQQLHVFIPSPIIDSLFLFYIIKIQNNYINSIATKTAVPYINKDNCNSIPIPLPPLPEQKAIAEVLGDVDRLINACDKLIAKKRDIKQGAMQELLAGRSRLPGFSGKWRVEELGDVSHTSSGTTPPRKFAERYYQNGSVNWVKTTDLNNGEIHKTEEQITDIALKETSLKVYPLETVLIAMYGGFNQIGRTGLLKISASVNQALIAIQPNHIHLASIFLINYLNYRVDYWKSIAVSSRKDPNITSSDVRKFPILLPPLSEQKAIAQILSDMDSEIEALEKKRDKYKLVKQGMMQELLTGKTRILRMKG
jgi:type I restriction enzyme S subunit